MRKLCYGYEQPIDYLDNLISQLYSPGGDIKISLAQGRIEVSSCHPINRDFIDGIANKSILLLAKAIPPSMEYATVEIRSGDRKILINEQRNITEVRNKVNLDALSCTGENPLTRPSLEDFHRCISLVALIECEEEMKQRDKPYSSVNISRSEEKSLDDCKKEIERLRKNYRSSDLEISINGEPLAGMTSLRFGFDDGEFSGEVEYNPLKKGEIHYFRDGRYISSEGFARGIEAYLYRHSLPITITKSKVITKGNGAQSHKRLEASLEKALADYIVSAEAGVLNDSSIASYQTLLRMVLDKYKSNEDIKARVRDNIRFRVSHDEYSSDCSVAAVLKNPLRDIWSGDEHLFEYLTGKNLSVLRKEERERIRKEQERLRRLEEQRLTRERAAREAKRAAMAQRAANEAESPATLRVRAPKGSRHDYGAKPLPSNPENDQPDQPENDDLLQGDNDSLSQIDISNKIEDICLLLGDMEIAAYDGSAIMMQGPRLCIPSRILADQDACTLAAMAVEHIETDRRRQLKLYQNIAKAVQRS